MAVKRTRSNILSNKGYIGLTGGVTNGTIDTLTAAVGEVRNNYLTATVGKRFNTATGLHFRQDIFIPSSQIDTSIKTWTRPKNVKWVEVLIVGGGGSGGSGRAAQAVSSSGGGGGGAVLYTRVYVADYDTWYIKCGLGAGQNLLNQNSSNFNSWGKPGSSSIFSPIPITWSYDYEIATDGLRDTNTITDIRPNSLKNNSALAKAVRGARYHGLHAGGGGGGGHPAGGMGHPMGGTEGGTSRGRRNKLLSANDGGPLTDGRFSRDNVFWGPGGYGGLGSNGDPPVQANTMGAGGGGGASERGRSGDLSVGGRGGNGATWLGLSVGGGGGGGRNAGSAGAGVFGGGNGGGSGSDATNGTGGGGGGGSNGTNGRGGRGTVVIRYWS
jgi:hypothetical protein